MENMLRALSAGLALLALLALGVLAYGDISHRFSLSVLHLRGGAVALMLIGLSYVALQLIDTRAPGERVKAIVLGTAFLLWGCEQLLPPSRLVTLLDAVVIAVFVIDLNVIIFSHLRRRGRPAP